MMARAAKERSAGEIIGYSVAMLLALAIVALLVLLAAPASGCGSRRVVAGRTTAAPPAGSADPDSTVATSPGAGASGESSPAASALNPRAAARAEPPPPEPSDLIGQYECRFTRGESELAPVPCAIRAAPGGELRLEQSGGAVRLSGTIVEDEAGFRLTGEVSCAGGRCAGPGVRDIRFFHQGRHAYSAVLLLRNGQFLNIDLLRKD